MRLRKFSLQLYDVYKVYTLLFLLVRTKNYIRLLIIQNQTARPLFRLTINVFFLYSRNEKIVVNVGIKEWEIDGIVVFEMKGKLKFGGKISQLRNVNYWNSATVIKQIICPFSCMQFCHPKILNNAILSVDKWNFSLNFTLIQNPNVILDVHKFKLPQYFAFTADDGKWGKRPRWRWKLYRTKKEKS